VQQSQIKEMFFCALLKKMIWIMNRMIKHTHLYITNPVSVCFLKKIILTNINTEKIAMNKNNKNLDVSEAVCFFLHSPLIINHFQAYKNNIV
jgi:hypothetical protein